MGQEPGSSVTSLQETTVGTALRADHGHPPRRRKRPMRKIHTVATIAVFAGANATVAYCVADMPAPTAATTVVDNDVIRSYARLSSKSAEESDVELDSPDWLSERVGVLASRGFRRINDPRRRR